MASIADGAHILCVVGARPNFMKIAPIMRALRDPASGLSSSLVHTGQHYDKAMKHAFFEQLHIPEPDIDLEVGSGSHAVQTAEIMKRFEPVLDEINPSAILVVGDVNSTIACALVAVKKGIDVIHVEAGLRSGDRAMPEEINRILTDQLSDFLFTTEATAAETLQSEGIAREKVHFVGNVMIDTLLYHLESCTPAQKTLDSAGVPGKTAQFGLLTLHRPSNVDEHATLERLLTVLVKISKELPLIFPIHPRTRQGITDAGFDKVLQDSGIVTTEPLGYLEMLGLMKEATAVFTDSGGIQEETTALGVPCITLRENTERPITVDQGSNTIVGTDPSAIWESYQSIRLGNGKAGRIPELWDGKAAQRIVQALSRHYA